MRNEAKKICDEYLGTSDNDLLLNVNDFTRASVISSLKKCSRNIFDVILKEIESVLITKFIQYERSN